jgi:hypothetical protein
MCAGKMASIGVVESNQLRRARHAVNGHAPLAQLRRMKTGHTIKGRAKLRNCGLGRQAVGDPVIFCLRQNVPRH